MEVWSSAEVGERRQGLINKISGVCGLWVGLQASVSCVQYIFVIHVHGGFSSGVIYMVWLSDHVVGCGLGYKHQ